MINLTREYVRKEVAYSDIIYQRGTRIYNHGAYCCTTAEPDKGIFVYEVDGSYGDYTTSIRLSGKSFHSSCDCPYPNDGCKHTVAVALDVMDRLNKWKTAIPVKTNAFAETALEITEPYLTPDEIREQAIEDRKKRARNEEFKVTYGDMYKGEHLIETPKGRQYLITLHDPANNQGHCTCPDFLTNRLGTCKHLIFLDNIVKKKQDFQKRLKRERFPFVDIFWDSVHNRPRIFCERPAQEIQDIKDFLAECFDTDGLFNGKNIGNLMPLLSRLNGNKRVRVQEPVFHRIDDFLQQQQLEDLAKTGFPSLEKINARLYPYQEEGIKFGLYKKAVLIGDEMGLGKTLQAITLAILKKEVFGFDRVLVVTLASLKDQWKREIDRFTQEKAVVIAGGPKQRQAIYKNDPSLFKITNYEAVLRDVTIISRSAPDLVILDEAQRIKNFNTKTAEAVKSIPRKHSLILTGTPLENKLEDVYSIVQFLNPYMLSPLWKFAADHFMLSRDKKGKILGYRNLEMLHEKLKTVVIRRRKEDVLSELPEEIVNNYYLDLTSKQQKMHAGYLQGLLPILNKKFLTPMDLRRIQELLLRMRQVCNSTYLIDRKTNISPKLEELKSILDELVLQNRRKVVIFSEWTTMTFLIAKQLSEAGISFVELSGKIPVAKRQALIDEFSLNPDCKVFLSTDAGGTGLNLQAADCVINFELPWNPARMNQRIGRVNRIGQKSGCINVVNFITKNSIEEKILTGIQLKSDLFKGVFDGGLDTVEFSNEKRTEMLNRLREMMGEEPELPIREAGVSEEIPEDTPHYLNPRVLENKDERIAYETEESIGQISASENTWAVDDKTETESKGSFFAGQSSEKLEEVLNTGMSFIGGLLEMATSQKIEPTGDDQRMIRIDRQTGEVTMKFKLPGF
ncbi:MAG: DEAD/DEAH box helicase [Desulfobacterales bacterium]